MAPNPATPPARPSDAWVHEVRRRLLNEAPALWQNFAWRSKSLPFWLSLIAEVLLQRTRASQAELVFRALQSRYPNAASLGSAPTSDLESLFQPLGLRWRTRLLLQLARELGRRRGRLARVAEELRQLPGVGEYAASAALSLHGGTRAVIIDANVVRVLCRLVGVSFDGETRRNRWLADLAERLTPPVEFREYNYALLDLGMQICRPVRPRCGECPLSQLCATGAQTSTTDTSTAENER